VYSEALGTHRIDMATSIESLPPPGWDRQRVDLLLDSLPPGELSEIVGPRSSGATSLLLALLARATAAGGLAALVDTTDALDPAAAAAAGADLRALLWVRCGGRLDAALRAADLLVRCPGFAVVALDLGDLPAESRSTIPPAKWLRLQRAVKGSDTVLVVRGPHHLAGPVAALVLSARKLRARWIGLPRPRRLGGLLSGVRVLRARRPVNLRGGGEGEDGEATLAWQP